MLDEQETQLQLLGSSGVQHGGLAELRVQEFEFSCLALLQAYILIQGELLHLPNSHLIHC